MCFVGGFLYGYKEKKISDSMKPGSDEEYKKLYQEKLENEERKFRRTTRLYISLLGMGANTGYYAEIINKTPNHPEDVAFAATGAVSTYLGIRAGLAARRLRQKD